jgi:hypothetical protein
MKTYGKVTGIIVSLAALAVSGIAFADPDPNRVKGKEKPGGTGPGSKFSIEVDNHCLPPDPVDNTMTVISKITNESEATIDVDFVEVRGLQLVPDTDSERNNPKKIWDTVGAVKKDPMPEISILEGGFDVYEYTVELCGVTPELQTDATALNVEVQVMVDGRNFVGNCDNQDIVDDEGNQVADESRIDIEDYPGLGC